MIFNPYGPAGETIAGGQRLREILAERQAPPTWVCGVNYVLEYAPWWEQFQQVPIYGGY